jgi:hypothetical protein
LWWHCSLSATAHAQLFRAYLAPSGVDSNPCTLAAPCRLLPAALAAVAAEARSGCSTRPTTNTAPVAIAKSVTILAVPARWEVWWRRAATRSTSAPRAWKWCCAIS